MTTVRIPSTSVQYYEVPVASSTVDNPTTLPVGMAFTDRRQPPSVFEAAEWTTVEDSLDSTFYVRILVGGTGMTSATVQLDPGLWHTWIRISPGPTGVEAPVLYAGLLVLEGEPGSVAVQPEFEPVIDGGTP